MKLSELPVGSYFQFKSDIRLGINLTYCLVNKDIFQQFNKAGLIYTNSYRHCEVVRVDIEVKVNKDKEMREAIKTEVIKILEDERSSICRRANFKLDESTCNFKLDESTCNNHNQGLLTEEQKDSLNKVYAIYDNFVGFFKGQDFLEAFRNSRAKQ